MYKYDDYKYFNSIVSKVNELESINRQIDYNKLEALSLIKDESVLEFASTNNIEGDVVSLTTAKQFIKNEDSVDKDSLEKRWIGIKRASEVMWSDRFEMNPEFLFEVHRALLREVETPGGIYKTKINQVGSLITSHPEDVSKEMFNLFTQYISVTNNFIDVYAIIPFISEFLAIHPYEDGNGRMSRLLMNKMMFQAGFKFTKYISVSKFLWDKRDEYISALESRNIKWGSNSLAPQDLIPLFEVILDAHIKAARKALEYSKMKKINFDDFKELISSYETSFSFKEIRNMIKASNSDATLKKWIKDLCESNYLIKDGKLKSTKYSIKK